MSEIVDWFSDPGRAALVNWAIAVVALFVAAAALVVSVKTQGKQRKLQGKLVEIEETRDQARQLEAQKARLRAEIIRQYHGTARLDHLKISNEGEAAACEISRGQGTELKIHNRDGRISQSDSHGHDPRDIPG